MPPYFVEQSNLRSRDALLSLAWPIFRGLLLLASVDAGTLALVEHSAAAAIARFARDALGCIGHRPRGCARTPGAPGGLASITPRAVRSMIPPWGVRPNI